MRSRAFLRMRVGTVSNSKVSLEPCIHTVFWVRIAR